MSFQKVLEITKACECYQDYLPKQDYIWNDNKTHLVAINYNNYSKILLHFIKVLEIKYINIGLCKKLVENKINTPEKLLNCEKSLLSGIIGDKLADKIYQSIHDTLDNTDTLKIIISLNIIGRNFGLIRLEQLVEYFGFQYFIDNIDNLDACRIKNIEGFSEKLATLAVLGLKRVNKYLDSTIKLKYYYDKSIIKYKSKLANDIKVTDNHSLKHLTVVFTGFRDKELENTIRKKGGKVSNTINKQTTHLVIFSDVKKNTNNKKIYTGIIR